MADDATRTVDHLPRGRRRPALLGRRRLGAREDGYRQQIKALEEQHKTLKNAWSDIVRTNLLKVDELKKELEAKRKTATAYATPSRRRGRRARRRTIDWLRAVLSEGRGRRAERARDRARKLGEGQDAWDCRERMLSRCPSALRWCRRRRRRLPSVVQVVRPLRGRFFFRAARRRHASPASQAPYDYGAPRGAARVVAVAPHTDTTTRPRIFSPPASSRWRSATPSSDASSATRPPPARFGVGDAPDGRRRGLLAAASATKRASSSTMRSRASRACASGLRPGAASSPCSRRRPA